MKPSTRWLVAALALALAPAATLACPACMVTDPRNAGTYLGMTLLMSALPLSLIGGLAWWLWRRYSQAADEESSPQPATNSNHVAEAGSPSSTLRLPNLSTSR